MKIDAYRTDISNQALDHVGRPTGASTASGSGSTAAQAPAATDEVRLSSDAQVLQAALETADQAPAIRQDVVDRMRALLENGEIGKDADRLADTLIDHLLTSE